MSLPLVTRFGADPLLDRELATKNYVDERGGFWTIVIKPTTTTINDDNTLNPDPDLLFPMDIDGNYYFEMDVLYQSTSFADLLLSFLIPTNAIMDWDIITFVGSKAATQQSASSGNSQPLNIIVQIRGYVQMGDTAGNMVFEWSQQQAEMTDTDVFKDSFIKFVKLS